MKQITEDFVSFEVAQLLKEKGFDANIYTCYTDCEFPEFLTMIDYVVQGEEYERSNFESHNLIQAPTHQMTLKWLREVHNWYIDIRFNRYYQYYIPIVYNMSGTLESIANLEERPKQYEQAVEAALLYVLKNLI